MLHTPGLIVFMWMLLAFIWIILPTCMATAWFAAKLPSKLKNRFCREVNVPSTVS